MTDLQRFVLNDEWTVEPRLYRLTGADGSRQIEPRVMGVLVELVRADGKPVSVERLLERVWETDHIAPEVVRRAIHELRKVFAEDAATPRFIETIPRVGYRLIAVVSVEKAAGAAIRRRGSWLAALALVGTAIGIAVLVRPDASENVSALQTRPLTSEPGIEEEPALSPGGGRVAFVKRSSDTAGELFVQVVGEASRLHLTSGAHGPAWWPDGSAITFLRSTGVAEGEHWEIADIGALGGAVSRVFDLGVGRPDGFARAPDGHRLVIAWADDSSRPTVLWVIDLETGNKWRLTDPPLTTLGDRCPTWSPDGTRLAFLRTLRPGVDEVWVLEVGDGEVDDGEPRRVGGGARSLRDVAWLPDGLALVAIEGGTRVESVVKMPLGETQEPEFLIAVPGATSLAVDGDRFAIGQAESRSRFVTLRPGVDGAQPLHRLSSTRWDGEVALAADGSRIAFVSTRSGTREIWQGALDGTDLRRLTAMRGAYVGEPIWSRDLLWIGFSSTASGDADIWRVDARGGLPEQLTLAASNELNPAFSNDGSWLYFASDRTGRWEIWRRPLDRPGDESQVTTTGGFRARESADGRWLYYSRRREGGLWRVPAGGGEPELVAAEFPPSDESLWSVGRVGLLLAWWAASGEVEVVLRDLVRGHTQGLGRLENVSSPSNVAISADGDQIVAVESVVTEGDLLLIERVDRSPLGRALTGRAASPE